MTNRIQDVHIVNHRLDPHETELRVHVEVENLTATTEIKGKLLGPRSAYASTVEIAYPLREVARAGHIEMRVVIPEACWWEPKTPFLYVGPVELWQDGALCDRRDICHGINHVQLTSKGLRLNGKSIVVKGKSIEANITDDEAAELHNQGVGLVMGPWDEKTAHVADRYGLFLMANSNVLPERVFLRHPSTFGYVLPNESLGYIAEMVDGQRTREVIVYFCSMNEIAAMEPHGVAVMVVAPQLPDPLPTIPQVIGWIESPNPMTQADCFE